MVSTGTNGSSIHSEFITGGGGGGGSLNIHILDFFPRVNSKLSTIRSAVRIDSLFLKVIFDLEGSMIKMREKPLLLFLVFHPSDVVFLKISDP